MTNPCVNNSSLSSDALHNIEIIGYRYVILTICIFGIVCNILNLCVLLNRRLKESPYTYLTGLALADMLTLMCISPFTITRGDYIHHENIFYKFQKFEIIYMQMANYFGHVSIMITLALTIERYLFTTYPLKVQSFCKSRYARNVIVIILIICGIIDIPRFTSDYIISKMNSSHLFDSNNCSTYPFIIENSINRNHTGQCYCIIVRTHASFNRFQDIYYYCIFVLYQILPFIILLYLNLKLIQRVQRSNRFTLSELVSNQQQTSLTGTPTNHFIQRKRIRDEQRLTKTLASIVLVFLICNTFTIISYPNLVIKLTEKKYPFYYTVGFRIQKLITNIMLMLNYSINFFFYCAFNQKFLKTLKLTFRCCIQKQHHYHRIFFSSSSSSSSAKHLSKLNSRNHSFNSFKEEAIKKTNNKRKKQNYTDNTMICDKRLKSNKIVTKMVPVDKQKKKDDSMSTGNSNRQTSL
ncbi:unnamed protein product [Didymodactylos carnosus]|uniref:G-protein coupled receptors family 1 profile domain-containing protein n=1 Tax=Didymodactylos carnosus TaxID=1234261 RepID=A0A813TZS2_9BILA|nr:unnamed protein product [Didymodactylos carnosus]CAF3602439.1 unnamed protein product [Didymodactylos carnosus]